MLLKLIQKKEAFETDRGNAYTEYEEWENVDAELIEEET